MTYFHAASLLRMAGDVVAGLLCFYGLITSRDRLCLRFTMIMLYFVFDPLVPIQTI